MAVPQVPAAPVRAHIQGLLDNGMTQAAICRAAKVSPAYLSQLLYGKYEPGRPPQQTVNAASAERLMVVEYYGPAAPRPATWCKSGRRFAPVGHRVGRCESCGQVAAVQTRDGEAVLLGHPRLAYGAQAPDGLPAPAGFGHPDCGYPRGHQRHVREHTAICEPCKAARRGYEQGMAAGLAKAARSAGPCVPRPLGEAVVKAMRAFLYRRPVPQLRQLAAEVVRVADADLEAEAV